MKPNLLYKQSGQTLIALLIFMLLAISVTTTAATITIVNIQAATSYNSGETALANAESGAENAVQRLERNPTYPGETMNLSTNNSATITVSGTNPRTVTSIGSSGNFRRTVVVTLANTNNSFTLTSWIETP